MHVADTESATRGRAPVADGPTAATQVVASPPEFASRLAAWPIA
ncbi:hypothetical protein QF032_006292 [Streptomyces achromogenes]|nr:hypothetical protein [Streptomyces achromogenes]MDQ0834448.1 hypothetical protein [Streptomyces achromogenes]